MSTKKPLNSKLRQKHLSKRTYQLFNFARQERDFFLIIAFLVMLCGLITPYPQIATWFGFTLASYSVIANDSIQTIGTFISSNAHQTKWWYLWLFISTIFVITVMYSWVTFHGDVSYQRLTGAGFEENQTLTFFQLFAPVALILLTRLYIPVSTTFLLLNTMATTSGTVWHMLEKSLYGYTLSFVISGCVWYIVARFASKYFVGKPWIGWRFIQWVTSGLLWAVWFMQDGANIAVFLPRQLQLWELGLFMGIILFGLGFVFYFKGGRLQKMVTDKSRTTDVRVATLIHLVYMVILYYFKMLSNVPMSTTWVFIGLLGGRELAIGLAKKKPEKREKAVQKSFKCIRRDLGYALLGLAISIVIAIFANPTMAQAIKGIAVAFWLRINEM